MPKSYTTIIIVRGYEQPIKSTHDNVSICICLGAAQGAWKLAPM